MSNVLFVFFLLFRMKLGELNLLIWVSFTKLSENRLGCKAVVPNMGRTPHMGGIEADWRGLGPNFRT